MTKRKGWPGWRGLEEIRFARMDEQTKPVAEDNDRRHCLDLLERLHPSEPEYQAALERLVELDGYPSAKERLG